MNGPDWREPQRACLPLARWPAPDREGWLAATSKGDFLLDDGPGAALKPSTLDRHRSSYGRWLGFLERKGGGLDPAVSPGARARRQAIEAYIAELEALNAPQTVVVRMQSLSVVLRWLAPEGDWAWLRRLVVRLEAKAAPVRDKRARLQLADALFALGSRLMAEAESRASSNPREARLFRDGLMIAFLSCHPLRLGNFRRLELGRHLRRVGDRWWLEVEGAETKTGQRLQLPVQARLVPLLACYLEIWRPQLASPGRVARSRALWLTVQGQAISATHAHLRITRHTARAFGRSVNPHLFRDAVATTIALMRPDKIGIVTPLLGHRSLATAHRSYNLAGMAAAAVAWHDVLDELSRS